MNIEFLKNLNPNYILSLLGDWVGGAVVGVLVAGFISQVRLFNVRKSYEAPIQVPRGDKRNLILLVGLGGSGKTSLVRSLFQDERVNHRRKTEHFTTYGYKHDAGFKFSPRSFSRKWYSQRKYHWLYISDYKGQNIAQLVRHFISVQRQPNSPLAFGYINSLIILVDLFTPKKDENHPELNKQKNPDQERINANTEQWNNMALTMLSGLVTDNLNSVILFISKVDLLADRSDEAEQQCKELYGDLRRRIDKVFHGIDCHVILGSAVRGTNVTGVDDDSLMFYLLSNSISPQN